MSSDPRFVYLVGAYAVIWVILLVYVFYLHGKQRDISDRLTRLQKRLDNDESSQ